MAGKLQRRQAPPGGLSVRQRWFLHRGYKFYSLSGFFTGRCKVPFPSEEAVRQAYFDHRDELLAEARQPLPEAVKRELILRPKYQKEGTTWAFRPKPWAFYEFEETGDDAVDIAGPAGSRTATPALTRTAARRPAAMTTLDPAEAPDGADSRP